MIPEGADLCTVRINVPKTSPQAKGEALGMNYKKVLERLTKDYSLKRLIEPSEIATAAVFLASDDASAITGHTLVVSCGLHISHY